MFGRRVASAASAIVGVPIDAKTPSCPTPSVVVSACPASRRSHAAGAASRCSLTTPFCIGGSELDLESTRLRHFVDGIEGACRVRWRICGLAADIPIGAFDVREDARRASPFTIGSQFDLFGGFQALFPCPKHRLDSSRTYSRYAFISIAPSIPHTGPCPGTMTSGSSQRIRSRHCSHFLWLPVQPMGVH